MDDDTKMSGGPSTLLLHTFLWTTGSGLRVWWGDSKVGCTMSHLLPPGVDKSSDCIVQQLLVYGKAGVSYLKAETHEVFTSENRTTRASNKPNVIHPYRRFGTVCICSAFSTMRAIMVRNVNTTANQYDPEAIPRLVSFVLVYFFFFLCTTKGNSQ